MRLEIRGFEKLSFRERQVVVLKEMGEDNETIATKLGLSQGSVATLLSRAKAKGYQVIFVVDGDPLNLFTGGDREVNE